MKKCIVILGMHRSGTSALSGVLHILGLHLGKEIIPPHPSNPKGFFENDRIRWFNEKILDLLHGKWDDTLEMQGDIGNSGWSRAIYKEFQEIIQTEFGDCNQILIKDPRISVLLPLYHSMFEENSIAPFFIIAV